MASYNLGKGLKAMWLLMFEPPWRHSGDDRKLEHWLGWIIGWAWVLAGLVLGAFLAPVLVQSMRLMHMPYEDETAIAITVLMGFLVQILGWGLLVLLTFGSERIWGDASGWPYWLSIPWMVIVFLMPLASVGYGLFRYLTWVGAGQREIIVAATGGFLIKAFILPAIAGFAKSKTFKLFMAWLRGGRDKVTY